VDKKHAKRLKRAKKKKKEKQKAHDQAAQMTKQMNMFDRMPDSCSVCEEPFPKTRDAHMRWRVAVRNTEQLVRLFCPQCQELGKKMAVSKDATEQETEEAPSEH